MDKEKIRELTKKNNKINYDVEQSLNLESNHICMICKEIVTSFCKSHSVPYSIFNHMNLENGEIIPHYNAAMKKLLTKVEKGKSNSGIFKLICNDCDQKYFSFLDNFNVISGKWNNELLRLQAQRINLYQIYRLKENSYTLYRLFEGKLSHSRIEDDKKYINKKVEYYKKIFDLYEQDKNEKFEIIYDKVLEYETNFSTVCILEMTFNPCLDFMLGKDKSDILNFESFDLINGDYFTIISLDDKHNNIVYILVLPYEGKTRVTLFCDDNSIFGLIIKNDFNTISDDDKLLFISTSLIISGRNIYGNKEFMDEYRKGCKVFERQFFEQYIGADIPEKSMFDIKEAYLNIYDNNINLFKNKKSTIL